MTRVCLRTGLALVSIMGMPAPALAQSFAPLGHGSGGESVALAVSADGHVVVGLAMDGAGSVPVRWTVAGGLEVLPLARGTLGGRANGVSGDGSVIVGRCGDRSVAWVGGTPTDLNTFGNGAYSAANAVSRDGLAIVGNAFNGNFSLADTWPYRWMGAGGCAHLGGAGAVTAGNFEGFGARGASADGSVVVGNEGMPIYQAFRWTALGMVGLGFLPFGPQQPASSAAACSADGSVLVGWSVSLPGPQAIRWTSTGGMVGIGDLEGGEFDSEAVAVSADGSIVVGRGTTGAGSEAFYWDASGMRPVSGALGDFGPTGWVLRAATGISADGRTIVGWGTNPDGDTEAWIVRLPDPGACYANCDGSTTPPVLNALDFSCFLGAFRAGDSRANCDGSTTPPVLNVLDFSCFLNRFGAGCG